MRLRLRYEDNGSQASSTAPLSKTSGQLHGHHDDVLLPDNATWLELITVIVGKNDRFTDGGNLIVQCGYPQTQTISPKSMQATLAELGIKNSDTLIIKERQAEATSDNDRAAIASAMQQQGPDDDGTCIVLRRMADDNSCLFNAVAYVLENHARNKAHQMRQIVANAILEDPVTYCEAILGKPPAKYVEWILQSDSWGGAIELDIFSRHYAVQIASIDVQSLRVDVFGEAEAYKDRAYVLYSGIHYDALALELVPGGGDDFDQTVFPFDDADVLTRAASLADEQRRQHKYTDLARFTLACETCRAPLVGEKEARAHAASTGHSGFREYE